MKYIKGLDSLRALAIVAVIISHWGLPIRSRAVVDYVKRIIFQDGQVGVDLFLY